MGIDLVVRRTMGDVYKRNRKGGVIRHNKGGHSIARESLVSSSSGLAWIPEGVRKSTRAWVTTSLGCSDRMENDVNQMKPAC